MIYTTKKGLAESLGKTRMTIDRMIRDNEVKEVLNQKGKRLGYVKVTDFIRYLIN